MRTLLKIGIVIFLAACILSCANVSHCEEADQGVRVMSGYVLRVDWVAALISVQGDYAMTFVVLPNTKIIRGTDVSSLFDIHHGDYVVIKYRETPTGEYQAVWVSIQKNYPPF